MDLFRMIFCVFFKDFQRGILFRARFFYTLFLLSSEFSSGLLSSAFFPTHLSSGSRFIRPLLSLAPYFLLPLLPFSPSLPATSAPLFSRLPRPLSSPGYLGPSLLPATSLLFDSHPSDSHPSGSHPSDSHPSGSHPFGLLPSGSLSPPPSGRILYFFAPPASDPVSAFCPALSSGAALGSFCRPGSIFTRCGFQM